MRRAAKLDANHGQIRSALNAVGWVTLDTSRFGGGWPDLLAVRRGQLVCVEIKDGAKPASRQKLRAQQEDFRALVERAGVPYRVVTSIDEAVRLSHE